MGTLYLVATPIGNLEDISQRALRILGDATLIAAEDTRVTIPMLQRFDITTRVVSYHDDSPQSRVDEIFAALATGDVAIVSDAGMPGISDPGSLLVREAIRRGVEVIPVPGPSAVIAAAAVSGAADAGFIFAGFLPRKSTERRRRLQDLAGANLPIVLYEAPGRVLKLLEDVAALYPDATVTVGREVTKLHEEWVRGSVHDVVTKVNPRGEFVLVVEPNFTEAAATDRLDDTLTAALGRGAPLREAVDEAIAATGLGRKQVYARAIELQAELRDRSGS